MQETIEQLKTILMDIFMHIEQRLEIERIDLKEFDKRFTLLVFKFR